jgi:hypothetical protein
VGSRRKEEDPLCVAAESEVSGFAAVRLRRSEVGDGGMEHGSEEGVRCFVRAKG